MQFAKQCDNSEPSRFARYLYAQSYAVIENAGIVESKGGRDGGYFSKKSSTEITLGDIYEAINSFSNEVEVDVDCGVAGEQLDVEFEKILHEAELKTIEYLRNYTVAQLMDRVQFVKEE